MLAHSQPPVVHHQVILAIRQCQLGGKRDVKAALAMTGALIWLQAQIVKSGLGEIFHDIVWIRTNLSQKRNKRIIHIISIYVQFFLLAFSLP